MKKFQLKEIKKHPFFIVKTFIEDTEKMFDVLADIQFIEGKMILI